MTYNDRSHARALAGDPDGALRDLGGRLAGGDGAAALLLGHWYMAGEFVGRDLSASRDYFARAAELGECRAEAPLIALTGNGAGGLSRDWQQATTRFAALGAHDLQVARQAALIARMNLDPAGDPTGIFQPEFLSQDPLVVQFRRFMTPEECDALVAHAEPRLAPATVVCPATGDLIRDPVRDSSAAAFPFVEESPFIHALNRRIAAASRSVPEQGEPLQVLSYGVGQQYKLHSDAIAGAANQRIQTFLVYLCDDFQGGATFFPHASLAIRPAKGDAICFSNVSADMRSSETARHAGLPVTSGRKTILSKWIRQRPLDLGLSPTRRA